MNDKNGEYLHRGGRIVGFSGKSPRDDTDYIYIVILSCDCDKSSEQNADLCECVPCKCFICARS